MKNNDNISNIKINIDQKDCLVSFEFKKIPCGIKIPANIEYSKYCEGKTLEEILDIPFEKATSDLNLTSEEDQFYLFVEWEALRSSIAKYLGIEREDIDSERCLVSSVDNDDKNIIVSQIILPPKNIPQEILNNK